MISEIEWLHFDPAIFVQKDETFWLEGRTLHVRALDGELRTFEARPSRPDDARSGQELPR